MFDNIIKLFVGSEEDYEKMEISKLFEILYKTHKLNKIIKIIHAITSKADEKNRLFVIEKLFEYEEDEQKYYDDREKYYEFKDIKYCIIASIDFHKLIRQGDIKLLPYLKRFIENEKDMATLSYEIKEYAIILQKDSYKFFVDCLLKNDTLIGAKYYIIRKLSELSNHPFDYLILDFENFALDENVIINDYNSRIESILNWQKEGYKDGNGYPKLIVSDYVENPKNDDELLYSNLYKKIEKDNYDAAHPAGLVIPTDDELNKIKEKWKLPKSYMDFLSKASPLNVTIEKGNAMPIELFGVNDLIAYQIGYSYNGITKEKNEEWPENYVVIASKMGDPYCIDINSTEGKIYYAEHGQNNWNFILKYKSFDEFLKYLAK